MGKQTCMSFDHLPDTALGPLGSINMDRTLQVEYDKIMTPIIYL